MAATFIVLTICLPWLGALVIWLTGERQKNLIHGAAVVFSLAAGFTALALLPLTSSQPAIQVPMGRFFGDLTFTADGLGVTLAVIATVVGSLAVIFSVDYMRGEAQLRRYYVLVLLFIGSMAGLVLTSNLLFLFFFWEMTAFCSYGLISFYNDDPKAVAGGIKALVITQIGGVGLLACALLASAYLDDLQVANFLSEAQGLPAGILAVTAFGMLAAAAAKSAQFPFHTWLPDAMEAPTPVSALIHAATMVNAGVYLLARFYPAFESVPGWKTAVVLTGLMTALLGALMALTALDLKRVLAYSTVSQLGYMVYAVGVGGVLASQFHLLSHAVFKALLFLAAGSVIHSIGTRDMLKMGALGKKLPYIRNVFIVGALALAGVPFLNGFWSKEWILEEGYLHGPAWALIGMVIVAGLTAVYTSRMVGMVFFGEPKSAYKVHAPGAAMNISLGILASGALVTWLAVGGFSHLLASSLSQHHLHSLNLVELMQEILLAPLTWLTLGVTGLGFVLYLRKTAMRSLPLLLERLAAWSREGFGFESINQGIVNVVQRSGEALSVFQTGQLNWNAAGLLIGLVVVLLVLSIGLM